LIHALQEVADEEDAKNPASHASQESAPAAAEKVPRGQLSHTVDVCGSN
jgi:hypothetical protein